MSLQIFIAFLILLFFWWIIKDYPKWRKAQLQKESSIGSAEADTLSSKQAIQLNHKENLIDQYENKKEAKEIQKDTLDLSDQQQQQQEQQAITLSQYILMMPMAVVYLLGRTIIDLSRGSIYLILYQGEKSIPIIDAWLFDKVTVWLPNKYEQLQQWWATRGKKIYQQWQTHFIHVTIPNAIDKIDQGIERLYHAGQTLQEMSTTIHQAWKKFRQQHDWQQLMIDLGYTFYVHLWQPWFAIMVRIANITVLLFKGVRQGIISTWHDLQWLVLQMVPSMLTWIKSTQVWQSGHHTLHQVYLFTHYCLHAVFLPVLQWCGQSLHYFFIDLLLQQWLLSDSACYYYKKVQQNIVNFHVWFCTDMVLFFNGLKWFCVMIVDDGLLPLCQAFQHHVIPQLSKVYYFLKSDMFLVYHTYVYPIWEIAVTWVQQYLPTIYHCLEHSYQSFTTFFTTFEWKWETMVDITSQFILFNQKIFTALFQSMSYVFSQQIPLVLKTFQSTWHHFIHDIDWQKILLTLEQMHQMIIDQCLIMVTSLERTLNEWASQQNDNRSPDGKNNKKDI